MKKNQKEWIGIILIGGTLFFFFLLSLFLPDEEYSKSERRKLIEPPQWSRNTMFEEGFSDTFEKYSMDHFPFRDYFRRIKSLTSYYLLAQKDNHGIYQVDGYLAKLEYPLNEASIRNAMLKFQSIYQTYLKGKKIKIYTAVIPDKGYFLANQNGYPSMDYEKLFQTVKNGMNYAKYIDLTNCLTITDYYKTDTHWRQEKIIKVAEKIAESMGVHKKYATTYEKIITGVPFYGVYYGQSALPMKSEKMKYITYDQLNQSTVYNYETKQYQKIYDQKKLHGHDPYEMFLSGAAPLLQIENPNAISDKELILFRDSFGSSLAPLFVEGYKKITLIDIRYISSEILGEYVDFDHQDVLFLYSTLILNNSYSLKP